MEQFLAYSTNKSDHICVPCIVSLHAHLPIYCCTINTIAYHLISIAYDYVK